MRSHLKFISISIILIFTSACLIFTPTPPSPEDQATSTPIVVTSPVLPSNTPAPASLNADGPFILFKGTGGIWITNPDGSFPTLLSENEFQGDLHSALSPTGDRLALVVSNDQGLDLVIVKIPSGETDLITQLIQHTPEQSLDATSPNSFATYAIRDYNSIAWQPGGGQLLAFIGAMNGPTADLYLYDFQSQAITQLTDGPSQAGE